MPFYSEGVMGNDTQVVADIFFGDDYLLYLCTPGMGVNMSKARASPCLFAEALRRATVSKGLGSVPQAIVN